VCAAGALFSGTALAVWAAVARPEARAAARAE
jgi:hypothetical protein